MKDLDNHTVLEIIKTIDAELQEVSKASEKDAEKTGQIDSYFIGKYDGLAQLADYLQSFIEGQLNAEELRTGE